MTRIHKFYNDCVKRLAWVTPPETSKAPEPAAAPATSKEVTDFEKKHGEVQPADSTVTLEDYEKSYDAAISEIKKSPDPTDAAELTRLENLYKAGTDKIKENYKARKDEVSKEAKEKVEEELAKIKDSAPSNTAPSVEDLQKQAVNEAFAEMAAETTTDFSAAVRAADSVDQGEGYAGFDVENAGMDKVDINADTVQQTAAGLLAAAYAEGGHGTMGPLTDRIRDIADKKRGGENGESDWTTEEAFYYDHFFDELSRDGANLREMHKDLVSSHHLGVDGWEQRDADKKGGFGLESVNQARGYVMGCLLLANENQAFSTETESKYKEFVYAMVDKAWEDCKDGPTFLSNVQKYVLTPKKWMETKDGAAMKAATDNPALFEFENTDKAKEGCKNTLAEYTRILAEKQGGDSKYVFTPEMQASYEILSAAIKDDSFGPQHFELLKDLQSGLKEVSDGLKFKKEEAEKKEDLEQANEYKTKVDEYAGKVNDYKEAVDAYKQAVEADPFDSNAVDAAKAAAQKQFNEAGSMIPSVALLKGKALLVVDTEEGKKIVNDADAKFVEAGKVVVGATKIFNEAAALEAQKTAAPAGTPGKVPGAPEAQKETPPDNLAEAQSLLEEAPDDTPELKEIKTHYKGKLDEVLKSGKPKEEQEKEIDAITTQYQLEILARGFEAQDNYERLAKQVKDSYTERQTRLTEEIANVKKQLEAAQAEQSPDQTKIENLQAQIALYEGDLAGTNFNLKVLEQLERDPYKEYPLSKRAVILAHMLEEYSMPGAEKNLHERLGDEAYKKLFEINGQPDFWGENWENPDNLPDPNSTDPAVQAERAKFDKANKRYEAKVAEFTGQNLTMTGKERNFRMPGGMQLREAGTDESVKLISGEIHYVKAENGRYAPFVKVETGEGDTAEQGWVALNLLKKGKGEGGGGGKKEKKEEEGPEKKQTPEIVLENRVREIVDLLTGAATLIENHNVPPKTDEDRQRLGEGIGKYIRAHKTFDEMMAKGGNIMKTPDEKSYPKGPVKIKLQNSDFNREIQWDGKKLSIPGGMAEFFSGGDLDDGKGAYENCVKVLTAKGLPANPKALEKWAKGNGCLVHDDEVLYYDRKVVTPEAMQKIADKIDGVHTKWTMLVADTEAGLNSKTITPYQAAEFVEKSKEILNDYQGCMDLLGKHNDIIGSVPEEDPHLQAKLYTKTAIQADIARVEQIKSGCLVFLESSGLLDDNGKVEKSKLQTPDKEQQLAEYERKLDGIRSFVDQLDAKLQGYIDDLAAWKKDPDDDDLKKAAYEAGLNLPSIPNTAILAWTQVKTLNDRAREASLTLSGNADVKNKLVRIFNATIKFPTADRRTLLERKARESDLIS